MLKNESAQNLMKPAPLRPSRLPDSGGIIVMSNGVRMEKISHSVRQAKQGKFWDADCTCPYSPYKTRVSPYDDTWQVCRGDMEAPGDDMWQVRTMTRGRFRTGHVAASEGDTCQADLAFSAYSWTNPEVTRVTTERVTCGRVTSAADVVGLHGR
jgi:hypothetical protein